MFALYLRLLAWIMEWELFAHGKRVQRYTMLHLARPKILNVPND